MVQCIYVMDYPSKYIKCGASFYYGHKYVLWYILNAIYVFLNFC